MAILVILLWTATLCTWYAVKTTPPRYIEAHDNASLIDTKEDKFYHPRYRRWVNNTVPYTESPKSKNIQGQYLEEIIGLGYAAHNDFSVSADIIIQGLDQNKYTASELRDVEKEIKFWALDNFFKDRNPDAPESKSEYNKIIQSIDNPNIKALFHEKSI